MKCGGILFREDREIALHVTGRNAGGLFGIAVAAGETRRNARRDAAAALNALRLSRCVSHLASPVFLDSKWDTGLT